MRYSLWHTETGNLIGDFATEADALQAVLDEVRINDDAQDLVLQLDRKGAGSQFVAAADDLLARAQTSPRSRRLVAG